MMLSNFPLDCTLPLSYRLRLFIKSNGASQAIRYVPTTHTHTHAF